MSRCLNNLFEHVAHHYIHSWHLSSCHAASILRTSDYLPFTLSFASLTHRLKFTHYHSLHPLTEFDQSLHDQGVQHFIFQLDPNYPHLHFTHSCHLVLVLLLTTCLSPSLTLSLTHRPKLRYYST